jgi:hypothetical protein
VRAPYFFSFIFLMLFVPCSQPGLFFSLAAFHLEVVNHDGRRRMACSAARFSSRNTNLFCKFLFRFTCMRCDYLFVRFLLLFINFSI